MPRGRDDEEQLTADLIQLARRYGGSGYRKIAALLRHAGWVVTDSQVERIWRRKGLKVPARQPQRGRLWLSDGACVRLRPERANPCLVLRPRGGPDPQRPQVQDARRQTPRVCADVIDEFTHECLCIRVARRLKAADVIDVLSDLLVLRGVPGHVRSDNGPEFIARAVQDWISAVGTKTACIAPGSPWENGYVESSNARPCDERLGGEFFCSLREAQIVIEGWRPHDNTVRPHGSLGDRPPAPEVFVPAFAAWPAVLTQPAPPAKRPLAQKPTLK